MSQDLSRRAAWIGATAFGVLGRPLAASAQPGGEASAMQAVLSYAQSQNTTGLLIVRDRKILVERNWPGPTDAIFRAFAYEATPEGSLLEDVASQQKSWVSLLVGVAIDKGLIDVDQPVAAYIGPAWSKASLEQEAKIRVIDVLTMSSGLTEGFRYAAPPGALFFYNTPVYAIIKKIVAAAARQPMEAITRDWLTGPAGMKATAWRKRPQTAAFAAAANPTGLVTSPRDAAKFGQIILDGGRAADGTRIVSETSLKAMFVRSAANPAYGRLWWLNGSAYAIRAGASRVDGPLIPEAPADLVAALGALDRKLYVVPSMNLIVVRMGGAAEKGFDEQLWGRLAKALI